MKAFIKNNKDILLFTTGAVVLLALLIWGCIGLFISAQPKFQDVTIELGTDTVSIRDFMTEYNNGKNNAFVSDVGTVDLNSVGDTSLTLRHGKRSEQVTLHIVDTTAPTAEFVERSTVGIDYVPNAADFVTGIGDLSETTVYFAETPVIPEGYPDITLTVVVEDVWGNSVSGTCSLSYAWLKESFPLEYGNTLTMDDLLLAPGCGTELLDQADIDRINASGIGEYTVESVGATKTLTCTVTVSDTQGPALELQEIARNLWESAELEDFIVSVSDASGDVTLRLLTELTFDSLGDQTVVIEAEDIHGNVTRGETVLHVTTDTRGPEISGLETLEVAKHSSPDFLAGVSAYDSVDGACAVTCDTGSLDLDQAGTYYITYTARDKSGNKTVSSRKVVVLHDSEDTAALVASIAAKLSNDPEELRDYVRDYVWYSSSWGGDDPVWNGFTNRTGNCYVHALCLKALFDAKGITSQLIWVTGPEGYEQTHYWLQVYVNGGWKHIDPTPSDLHGRYSLMNDEQRYETLIYGGVQRDWDRTKWPACG